jgi:hypothetical protein
MKIGNTRGYHCSHWAPDDGPELPEACWAVNKRQDNKLENCCNWLVIYLNWDNLWAVRSNTNTEVEKLNLGRKSILFQLCVIAATFMFYSWLLISCACELLASSDPSFSLITVEIIITTLQFFTQRKHNYCRNIPEFTDLKLTENKQ